MKLATVAIALLLAAGSVAAQDASGSTSTAAPAQPDFSRPTLIRILSNTPEPPPRSPNVTFHFGAVEFRALGTRWRIIYLPMMMFAGSFNRGRGLGSNGPDPFALTGTEIPQTERTWHDMRAMSSELKRIELMEHERAKIRVDVKQQP